MLISVKIQRFRASTHQSSIESVNLPMSVPMAKHLFLGSTVALALMLGAVGCNAPESTTPSTSAESQAADPSTGHEEHGDHAGHDHSGHATEEPSGDSKTDMEKMTEALADLSADDRESAMKQHVCPVSDQMLGSMGLPEKVDVNGQSVWICCDGCKDKLLADPEKYIAKLSN